MTAPRPSPRRPSAYRLLLEPLEDRLVPATFTVNSSLDLPDAVPGDGFASTEAGSGSGVTTLRAAIMEANALAGPDTIILPSGTYTLTISGQDEDGAETGDLDITEELTINGANAATTIIQAGTIGGGGEGNNGIDRVFHILNPSGETGGPSGQGNGGLTSATLTNVTIRNGRSTTGDGGGILHESGGTLTLTTVTVADNLTFSLGGGLENRLGTSIIASSTFSGNTANVGGGGISTFAGFLDITNSTLSGNTASFLVTGGAGPQEITGAGGAIFDGGGGEGGVSLTNVTITQNVADEGGGIFRFSGGAAVLTNTIVADNFDTEDLIPRSIGILSSTPGSDLSGDFISGGNNLIGNGDGSTGFTDGVLDDQVGDSSTTINPMLGDLADNGGETLTHLPLTGSPAIDNGQDGEGIPNEDQRGTGRPQGAGVDIGAVEVEGEGGAADVEVDITTPNGFVDVGKKFTYTIVVSNNGTDTATGVTLIATLPDGVKFKSVVTSQGSAMRSGRTITGDIGTLGVGDEVTVTVVIKPKSAGLLNLLAEVDANETDPVLANNTDDAFHFAGRPLFIDDRILALLLRDD